MSINTLCPNPGCRREVPVTAPRCPACGAVIVRRGAAPKPVLGARSSLGWKVAAALVLALVGVTVWTTGVGLGKARWRTQTVDGLTLEAPKLHSVHDFLEREEDERYREATRDQGKDEEPSRSRTRDMEKARREKHFRVTSQRRGRVGETTVEVLHMAIDSRTTMDLRAQRISLDGAAREAMAALSSRPGVKVKASRVLAASVAGTAGRRVIARTEADGEPRRNEGLVILHDHDLWTVMVTGPDSPETADETRRVLDSVRPPGRP